MPLTIRRHRRPVVRFGQSRAQNAPQLRWLALVVVLLAGCTGQTTTPVETAAARPTPSGTAPAPTPSVAGSPAATAPGAPELQVTRVARGLSHPWDLGFLPDGRVLVTERSGRLLLLSVPGGGTGAETGTGTTIQPVQADLSLVYARGEGGLMGLLVHPDFARDRKFTTCQTHAVAGEPVDIRVVTWRLSADGASAGRVRDLVTGIPLADSGRHSGCRLALDSSGALLIGTGDSARASVPQDRTSLGGKVLRVRLDDGAPLPDNPFAASTNGAERMVLSYGHRNIQGIALRPGTSEIWTAEHGPSFDDEVNRILPGRNYGWDPSRGGTQGDYDESVPMTDLTRFPDAVPAVWSSGETTEAICGLAFLAGPQWRGDDGAIVITALKGAKLLVLRLDAVSRVASVRAPPALQQYGRLRAVHLAPDGALWVSTSNGTDDSILRVVPT